MPYNIDEFSYLYIYDSYKFLIMMKIWSASFAEL